MKGYDMNMELLHIAIIIVDLVITFSTIGILIYVFRNRITDDELLKSKKILQEREQEEREQKVKKYLFRNEASYETKLLFLSQMGAYYHIGKITPVGFFVLKILSAVFFSIVLVSVCGMIGGLMGVFGYFVPELLLQYINNRDNDRMLADIKALYDSLLINIESGVFLTEAFAESYKIVTNGRLKKAILELNAEMVATNDIEEAINKFELKFKNPYISNLAVILRQQKQSGLSADMLRDMSVQMEDIMKELGIKMKEKLDWKGFFGEVFLYLGIVVVCFYICFYMFTTSMSQF